MNAKRTSVTVSEMVLWTAVLLAAVVVVEFDVQIEAFVTRHVTACVAAIFCICGMAAAWALVTVGTAEPAGDARALPQTWTRPVDNEPPCDLCGSGRTCFHCDDHDLILCAGCSYRHDARYHCNVRYVPTVHEVQERRA